MDERVQKLFSDLCNYTVQDLAAIKKISAVVDSIRRAGYDIFVIIEPQYEFVPRPTSTGEPNFTVNDRRFARGLKINLGDDPKTSEGE